MEGRTDIPQINTNLNENETAYSTLLSVLKYYKNIVELDSSYNNSTLEEYLELSEKEFRKKLDAYKFFELTLSI
ncbi:MAG: hypothetical protein ACJAZK_000655 [Psychroserpens sp.]|uniref:hypothetical protein n=1 Tax=Psychroserpens sp. TaxID=2020870 RepID=UPI0039E3348D